MAKEIIEIVNTTEFSLTVTGPNNFSSTVEAYSSESYSSPIAIGGFSSAIEFDLDSSSANNVNKVFDNQSELRYTWDGENDSSPLPMINLGSGEAMATEGYTMYVTILPQANAKDTWVLGVIDTGTSTEE